MAENGESGEKKNKKMIECNRQSLVDLQTCVEENIKRILHEVLPDMENGLYITQIIETYRKNLLTNSIIDGQSVNSLNDLETCECEPFDTAKENYIQQELMDQFCQQVVKTTTKWKIGPKQANKRMKKIIKPELKHVVFMKVDINDKCKEDIDASEKSNIKNVSLDDVTSRFNTITEKITTLETSDNCLLLKKAKNISMACEINEQSANIDMAKALYETPPDTPSSSDKIFIIKDCERKVRKKILLPP